MTGMVMITRRTALSLALDLLPQVVLLMFQAAAVLVSQLSVKRNPIHIPEFFTTATIAKLAAFATRMNAKLASKVNAARSKAVVP